jgi:hypothetical protein
MDRFTYLSVRSAVRSHVDPLRGSLTELPRGGQPTRFSFSSFAGRLAVERDLRSVSSIPINCLPRSFRPRSARLLSPKIFEAGRYPPAYRHTHLDDELPTISYLLTVNGLVVVTEIWRRHNRASCFRRHAVFEAGGFKRPVPLLDSRGGSFVQSILSSFRSTEFISAGTGSLRGNAASGALIAL